MPPPTASSKTERVRDDHGEHRRDISDVEQDDQDRHADIAERHDGNDDVGNVGNTLDTAIDDDAGDDRKKAAGPDPVDTQAVLHGAGDGIALERVEAEREGGNQGDMA